jgi:hypothetical protein
MWMLCDKGRGKCGACLSTVSGAELLCMMVSVWLLSVSDVWVVGLTVGRRRRRAEGPKGRWDDRDSRWGDIVMISMYDGWVTNWNTG